MALDGVCLPRITRKEFIRMDNEIVKTMKALVDSEGGVVICLNEEALCGSTEGEGLICFGNKGKGAAGKKKKTGRKKGGKKAKGGKKKKKAAKKRGKKKAKKK